MGGQLTYVCTGPGKYAVNLSIFRDCNGINLSGSATITVSSATCNYNNTFTLTNFGASVITPLCVNEPDVCTSNNGNGTYGVEEWVYRGTIQIPVGCGSDWRMSWSSCCRNFAITTLQNGGSEGFYVSALLDNTASPCNIAPAFNNKPTVFMCANQENKYNQGVADAQGDSLVYTLVDCLDGANTPVVYNAPLSGTNPVVGTTTLDQETGELTILPSATQVGVLCIKIEEYRGGSKIGEVTRDVQFIVTDCATNTLPIVSGINGTADSSGTTGAYSIDVCVGNQVDFNLVSFDNEAKFPIQDITTMKWNNGILGANFIVDFSANFPTANFKWTPGQNQIGSHDFLVTIADDACPVYGTNIFTYTINVLPNNLAITASGDTTVGSNEDVQLSATSNVSNVTYNWSPATGLSCTDCANPVATLGGLFTDSITYTVTIGDTASGCFASDDVQIKFYGTNTDIVAESVQLKIFPNPANGRSAITYSLTEQSDIRIEVFDMLGKQVGLLADQAQGAGNYQYAIEDVVKDNGMYLVRLTVNGKSVTRKVMFY